MVTLAEKVESPQSSQDMLTWQYKTLLAEIQQVELHASDPNCPCQLVDLNPPELCLSKHTLNIHSLAMETAVMDKKSADWLRELGDEAYALHLALKDRIVCGKPHKEEPDAVEWARKWRKERIEPIYYACKSAKTRIRLPKVPAIQTLHLKPRLPSPEKPRIPRVTKNPVYAGFGEISQFVNRPQPKGFQLYISETPKGGKWGFLGNIPAGLVQPGTGSSLSFNSREEAVQAAKRLGYEEGKIYSKETGKEIFVIPKPAVKEPFGTEVVSDDVKNYAGTPKPIRAYESKISDKNNKQLGSVKYAEYDNFILIGLAQVAEEFQGMGVASKGMKDVLQLSRKTSKPIATGKLSELGERLVRSLERKGLLTLRKPFKGEIPEGFETTYIIPVGKEPAPAPVAEESGFVRIPKSPRIPRTPAAVKEPWQMTKDYYNEFVAPSITKPISEIKTALISEMRRRLKESPNTLPDTLRQNFNPEKYFARWSESNLREWYSTIIEQTNHKSLVAQALSEGKPVPPEVLKDYPELAAQVGKVAPKPTIPAPVAPPVAKPQVPKPAVKEHRGMTKAEWRRFLNEHTSW